MSIHKSQGQTIDRVKVDLSAVFEKGQGEYYTRLSVLLRGSLSNPVHLLQHTSRCLVLPASKGSKSCDLKPTSAYWFTPDSSFN